MVMNCKTHPCFPAGVRRSPFRSVCLQKPVFSPADAADAWSWVGVKISDTNLLSRFQWCVFIKMSSNVNNCKRGPSHWSKAGHFGCFGGPENGTSGAQIKILKSLFNTNTPLKPPFSRFGNNFRPRKSDFWPFYWFWSFSHWNSHWSRKKSTHMWRKGRRAKTKTVLKPVHQGAKLGNMQNKDFWNS